VAGSSRTTFNGASNSVGSCSGSMPRVALSSSAAGETTAAPQAASPTAAVETAPQAAFASQAPAPARGAPALPAALASEDAAVQARRGFPDLVPTRQLAPGMALSPEGGWVFPLPRSKEECVQQAAQVGPHSLGQGSGNVLRRPSICDLRFQLCGMCSCAVPDQGPAALPVVACGVWV
jgi:hypothetical protein